MLIGERENIQSKEVESFVISKVMVKNWFNGDDMVSSQYCLLYDCAENVLDSKTFSKHFLKNIRKIADFFLYIFHGLKYG